MYNHHDKNFLININAMRDMKLSDRLIQRFTFSFHIENIIIMLRLDCVQKWLTKFKDYTDVNTSY